MERSRLERGGDLRYVPRILGALLITSIVSASLRLFTKNQLTRPQHGGWTDIDFTEFEVQFVPIPTSDLIASKTST